MQASKQKFKNSWAKTRRQDDPYMIVCNGNWEWRILKAYKSRQSETIDPYSRWFMAVKSPFTYGSYELGDGYVAELIPYLSLQNKDTLLERLQADEDLATVGATK